jgi:hypothetical protein
VSERRAERIKRMRRVLKAARACLICLKRRRGRNEFSKLRQGRTC